MCLTPINILNRHFTKNKKNGGYPPPLKHPEMRWIECGCGMCPECRKKRYNNWRIRLLEEMKWNEEKAYFVTLSFSPEALKELCEKTKLQECNAIAIKAVRLFLERYRKYNKKSVRHWFVTELGKKNSERIHLHGFIWTSRNIKDVLKHWKYGNTDVGYKCDSSTITYIAKYLHKDDKKHPGYIPVVLTSPGIGAEYLTLGNGFFKHQYRGKLTNQKYRESNGQECGLPQYYRHKVWNEKEREALWLLSIKENIKFYNGRKFELNIPLEEKAYISYRNQIAEELVKREDWYKRRKDLSYNITERMLVNYKDISSTKNITPAIASEIDYSEMKHSKAYATGLQAFEAQADRKYLSGYAKLMYEGILEVEIKI